jgi:hypothetical protein
MQTATNRAAQLELRNMPCLALPALILGVIGVIIWRAGGDGILMPVLFLTGLILGLVLGGVSLLAAWREVQRS